MTSDLVTPADTERRIMEIDQRLEELVEEHRDAVEQLATAEAAYQRSYLSAHITSIMEHPKRRVGEHETVAQLAAIDEYEGLQHAKGLERTIREAQHSYRQVLSSFQSLNANVRHQAGLTRYGGGR